MAPDWGPFFKGLEMEEKELNVKELKRTEDGKYILPLESPFNYGERKVDSLNLTEPKTKHLRRLPAAPKMDDMLKIVGDLAGEPDSLIDELSMKDGAKAAEFFSAFM